MQLLAPYNTKKPEISDILQLFHVYNGDTKESIEKTIKKAINPKFKLIICTAYPGEDKLMENLRSLGFVQMKPEILRVPSYYNGSKVKLFVLKGKG
jgi:hypothetical protein